MTKPATQTPEPGLLPEIDCKTAKSWVDSREAIMLDIREASEFDFENIPGSVLLPLSFIDKEHLPPLEEHKIIVICAIGKRALAAQKQLQDCGYVSIFTLTGGIDAWKKAGLETQGGKFEVLDYTI